MEEALEPPAERATGALPGLELYVPLAGLTDADAERERLAKELAELDFEVGRLEGKLANPQFIARAPARVVAGERAKLREYEARRGKVRAELARLS